jgi:ribonuclease HII
MRQGHRLIAGVDEAGRGSWAGPVVAAAVVLPLYIPALLEELAEVRDSKLLSAPQREDAAGAILRHCTAVAVGWATHHVVDERGLNAANLRAMLRAVAALRARPDSLLIDYFRLPDCPLPQISITKGDSQCLSIAAASIIAKVFRDRWMEKCEVRFPGYGFARHKGYGTPAHREALRRLGPSPIHRMSFAPLAQSDS